MSICKLTGLFSQPPFSVPHQKETRTLQVNTILAPLASSVGQLYVTSPDHGAHPFPFLQGILIPMMRTLLEESVSMSACLCALLSMKH